MRVYALTEVRYFCAETQNQSNNQIIRTPPTNHQLRKCAVVKHARTLGQGPLSQRREPALQGGLLEALALQLLLLLLLLLQLLLLLLSLLLLQLLLLLLRSLPLLLQLLLLLLLLRSLPLLLQQLLLLLLLRHHRHPDHLCTLG